jgi:hypothetical protein
MTTTGPLSVSRFEAALVRMLRSLLRPPGGEPFVGPAGRLTPPQGLSPECIHLVRDGLSKGCVSYLAKAGGWRRERHLRGGKALFGRLWERSEPEDLALSFSSHTLLFLIWLTAGRPEKLHLHWDPPQEELTPADQFLLLLAYHHARGSDAAMTLRGKTSIARHGLIHLFFPEDFAAAPVEPTLDFAIWVDGVGAAILEALQPLLHKRWLELERGKNQIGEWIRLRQMGVRQEHVLAAFLQETEAAKRPDLARFLLKAMSELLTRDLTPVFWIGGLQGQGPPRLADRLETHRQGLAVLRQMQRLGEWTRKARNTGFLDEDYQVAQLWLADWELYRGDELVVIADNLLRQVEPLKLQPAEAATAGDNLQKSEVRSQKSE